MKKHVGGGVFLARIVDATTVSHLSRDTCDIVSHVHTPQRQY